MDPENQHPLARELAEEIQNFQEIARYLNPSSGEIPDIQGIDIAGLSMPFREVIGGDHIIYIDFKRRYNWSAGSPAPAAVTRSPRTSSG